MGYSHWNFTNRWFNEKYKLLLTSVYKKRYITTSIHMFEKQPKDKYDFILGCNLLKDLGFNIHYSALQFAWGDIIVDMIPSDHWAKEKISYVATSRNTKKIKNIKNELCLTEILLAEYKSNIIDIMSKQTYLTPEEQQQLSNILFDIQDLFLGN